GAAQPPERDVRRGPHRLAAGGRRQPGGGPRANHGRRADGGEGRGVRCADRPEGQRAVAEEWIQDPGRDPDPGEGGPGGPPLLLLRSVHPALSCQAGRSMEEQDEMKTQKALRTRERFLPFAAPLVGQEEVDAVVECVRSGWLTTGFKVKEFEKAF